MAARLDGCIERKLTADPGRRFSLLKFKLPITICTGLLPRQRMMGVAFSP